MNNVLIIGAGKLGKGFIGEAFEKAKWNVTFLDKDPKVVKKLAEGSYQVDISTTDKVYTRVVKNYQQILTSDKHNEVDSFLASDLVMIPVYPEDLKDVFKYLIIDFKKMMEEKSNKKLDIILLTNKIYLVSKIKKFLNENVDPDLNSWLETHIFIHDAIIRRSTSADSNYALKLNSMAVASLLIEKPLHVDLSKVDWMEPIENVPTLKEVKIYGINGPHAATAFFGWYKNYKTIPEAQSDHEIQEFIKCINEEIYNVCQKEFNLTTAEYDHLTKLPTLKQEVPDPIKRVAYDPLRKLSINDRLCGPIRLSEKYGLDNECLIKAVALGLKYNDEDDPKSQEMQEMIKTKGVLTAIKEITGLDDNCANKILDQYEKL